ncbi:MAG: M15 family metallopeptidase [Myxococcales bacterium]|nr:M15 family metallopeptidase [Myxococcales bacterium]
MHDTLGNAAVAARVAAPPPRDDGGLLRVAEQGAAAPTVTPDATATPAQAVPPLGSNPDVTHASAAEALKDKPEALAALNRLRDDPAFAGLTPAQQGALYQQFLAQPNGATAQYLSGVAAYHGSEDKTAGYAAFQNALKPDGGSFTLNGTAYTIRDGQLLNADGTVAGDIRTDGTYQLNGQDQRTSIYPGLQHVTMTEGSGDQKRTVLEQSDVPALGSNADVTHATATTSLANNPRAITALNTLRDDPTFAGLTAAQQGALYEQFLKAPNAATAQYLRGVAAYHGSEDKTLGYAAFRNALLPDGGEFTSNGQRYTIQNGQLIDPQTHEVRGDIHTDGTFKLTGQTERTSIYDDIRSRVKMTEGTGDQRRDLLDLHDADPRNKLGSDNVNDTFAGMARSTLRAMRRENVDMQVTDGYRDYRQQDDLYAQGRSRPGRVVTNAPGGRSWHNYGVAADLTFSDESGQPHWPENGDYAQLWRRYGAVAQNNGLTWGGNWQNPDRPHIEYHPGYTASQARQLEPTLRQRGLQATWRQMGI